MITCFLYLLFFVLLYVSYSFPKVWFPVGILFYCYICFKWKSIFLLLIARKRILFQFSFPHFPFLTNIKWDLQARLLLIFFILQSSFQKLFDMRIRFSNHIFSFKLLSLTSYFDSSFSKQSMYERAKFSSVQSLSHVWLFVTPWTIARQASLSITNSQSLSKLMSIEWVMPSNHLILCHPLLLLPSIFLNIRVFSNESALHIRWPKYWSFSFRISLSNEHPGLISFRMDWLDLLAVQGTLKSLLQHRSSKASILLRSAFFIVQLSHPYMTTGKTITLTRLTFVDKVMSLLLNMLSRLVITFLPRSKHFSISWLHSPSAVILQPEKIKSATVSTVSPSICHEVMGPDAMILVFWMLSFKLL